MQEDLQKNFILLSKIAKEKKYAQEYMGLLARRGDIGSIRIGKRWYTTWAWFEEFLECARKKKEVVSEVEIENPIKVEPEMITSVEKKEQQAEINVPLFFPQRESVYAMPKAENISSESSTAIKSEVETSENPFEVRESNIQIQTPKINLPPKKIKFNQFQQQVFTRRREQGVNVAAVPRMTMNQKAPKKIVQISNIQKAWEVRRETKKMELPQMISVQKKNENPLPYKEIKFRENQDVFSPAFGVSESIEKVRSTFFPKLVFATSFAIMVFLIAASGYFVFSDGIFKKGTVAGVSNERNGAFAGINFGGEYFLISAGDKMKESLSVSRVAVQAAKERSANNEQQPVISAN